MKSPNKQAETSSSPVRIGSLKKRQQKEQFPLSVQIAAALRKGAAHLDDLCAVATECRPMRSPSQLKDILDKMVEREWIIKLSGDWYAENADRMITDSNLFISPNKQEKAALSAIGKQFWSGESQSDYSNIAHYVLLVALQHPKQIHDWLKALVDYESAEGIIQKPFLWRSIAAAAEAAEREHAEQSSNDNDGDE